MDRLYRWICNHRALAKTVYTIALLIDVVYFMPQQSFMLVLLILLALFLTFMVFAAIDNCYVQLLKKPVKLLNEHCDPYPYLEQTELLATYKLTDTAHQLVFMDQAAMLLDIGNGQEAYDLLMSINIDKYAGILPVQKAIYYNNLACSCLMLSKTEEARIWYEKSRMIAQDIRSEKMKKLLTWAQSTTSAELLYSEGKYDDALDALTDKKAETLRQQVSQAAILGKILFAKGDFARAAEYLTSVCINGNRMYVVTEAKNLLEKLKNSEISC